MQRAAQIAVATGAKKPGRWDAACRVRWCVEDLQGDRDRVRLRYRTRRTTRRRDRAGSRRQCRSDSWLVSWSSARPVAASPPTGCYCCTLPRSVPRAGKEPEAANWLVRARTCDIISARFSSRRHHSEPSRERFARSLSPPFGVKLLDCTHNTRPAFGRGYPPGYTRRVRDHWSSLDRIIHVWWDNLGVNLIARPRSRLIVPV